MFFFLGVSVCVGCVACLMDVHATVAGGRQYRPALAPKKHCVSELECSSPGLNLTPPTFPFRRRVSTPFLDGIKRVPPDSQPAVAGRIASNQCGAVLIFQIAPQDYILVVPSSSACGMC